MDPHVSSVRDHLVADGVSCFVFDRYSKDSAAIDRSGETIFFCDGIAVAATEIGSVWWRLKPISFWKLPNSELEIANEFADREWRALLTSLPYLVDKAFWLNPFPAHVIAAHKPLQLRHALEIGFKVPETLFSNNPAEVRQFISRQSACVYKQFSNFVFPSEDYIFTSEVTAASVEKENDALILAPGIFQRQLLPKHEWRVTVVDDEIFSFAVHSPMKSRPDWRRTQDDNEYVQEKLDGSMEKLIRQFMKKIGIVYGAIDFIETRSGDIYFLECNPAGQWLWLEHITGVEISRAVARVLATRRSSLAAMEI